MEQKLADLTKFFRYLDDLRESGETNMYGAGVYVQEEFGLDRNEAREIVIAWMRAFDGMTPPELRAARSLKSQAA